jgi:hypothetical protein
MYEGGEYVEDQPPPRASEVFEPAHTLAVKLQKDLVNSIRTTSSDVKVKSASRCVAVLTLKWSGALLSVYRVHMCPFLQDRNKGALMVVCVWKHFKGLFKGREGRALYIEVRADQHLTPTHKLLGTAIHHSTATMLTPPV